VREVAHRVWLARDVRRCAAVVVPSCATRDDLLRLHPEAAPRVHVVPNGFDPEPWEAAGEQADPRRALPGAPRYAVLVGATHRRKGVEAWLDALPLLDDLGLAWVLVGAPDADTERRIGARRTERCGAAFDPGTLVGGRVAVWPCLGDASVARVVAGARLLVFPSLSEGFGYPPLEAMAAGVPVVAARAGAVPEVCADAAWLVEPGDPRALASGVRRVLADPDLRDALVERGRGRARAFPPAETARALLAVLRRAAAEGAP
jgi:glycosyltransferase involved in cell wall biosynthesis